MISRIDATNYRCFEHLGVPMDDLCIVVGANGSGKTTLLDIPVLIGDLLKSRNIAGAFLERHLSRGSRASSLKEIPFRSQQNSFSLGLEARLPENIQSIVLENSSVTVQRDKEKWPTHIRYELRLELERGHQLVVKNEYLFIFPHSDDYEAARLPVQGENVNQHDWRFILRRDYGTEAYFRPEVRGAKERTAEIDKTLTAFARLQYESEREFAASRWFLDLLQNGVLFFDPTWSELRKASPPGLPQNLMGSGENLPWLALRLQQSDPERFGNWVAHTRTALPQISGISVIEREEDYHAYFRIEYEGGYAVTSSGLSEGTLRILALTLTAYLDEVPALIVIEEPENSIHPQAIDTILQSLRSLYDRQVWVSSHSPVVLAGAKVSELLITKLGPKGAAIVLPGQRHPRLTSWKGAIDLGSLFAAGVFE